MLDSKFRSGRWGVCVVLFVAGMMLWTGCNGGGNTGPSGTVSGAVTLAGQPVPQGCRVVFVSAAGFTASGEVGADGTYELAVMGKNGSKSSDVPAATYTVSVTPPASGGTSEADYDAMMEQSASGEAAPAKAQPAAEVIPAKFQSSGTSGLSFEVKAGSNTIDIALE